MTHDETVQALRKSLLMGETPEDRHGVYPKRRPIMKYEKPASIHDREGSVLSDEGWVE